MFKLFRITYGSREYQDMVRLRELILRLPLGLHFTPDDLLGDKTDLLIGCFNIDTGYLIGCCILSPLNSSRIRLRQMAVSADQQRKGAGRSLLAFAESQAIAAGYDTLVMHARKTAIPFYEQAGYRVQGREFLELGIAHVEMTRQLRQ